MKNKIGEEPFGKLHTKNVTLKSIAGPDLSVQLYILKLTIDFGFNNMFILVYWHSSGEHKGKMIDLFTIFILYFTEVSF